MQTRRVGYLSKTFRFHTKHIELRQALTEFASKTEQYTRESPDDSSSSTVKAGECRYAETVMEDMDDSNGFDKYSGEEGERSTHRGERGTAAATAAGGGTAATTAAADAAWVDIHC